MANFYFETYNEVNTVDTITIDFKILKENLIENVKILRKTTDDINSHNDDLATVVYEDNSVQYNFFYNIKDTGLETGTNYYYKIFTKIDGEYISSDSKSATPTDVNSPTAPTIDSIDNNTNFQATINFSKVDETNIDKYEVWWRNVQRDSWFKEDIIPDGTGNYSLTVLTGTCYIRVFSVDTTNNNKSQKNEREEVLVGPAPEFLRPDILGSYWSEDIENNRRVLYWKKQINDLSIDAHLNNYDYFEVKLYNELNDVYYFYDNYNANFYIDFQDGDFTQAMSVDIGERKQDIIKNFEWQVKFIYDDESNPGRFESAWTDAKSFELLKRKDYSETENIFENLADRNVYNKDVLKYDKEKRKDYNVWNIERFLSQTLEKENWNLERRGLDVDFTEIRDKRLNEFGKFYLNLDKRNEEEWVEYRYKVLELKNSFLNGAGRLIGIQNVGKAFTGSLPKVREFNETPGWILSPDPATEKTSHYVMINDLEELSVTDYPTVLYRKESYLYAIEIMVYDPLQTIVKFVDGEQIIVNQKKKDLFEKIINKILHKHIKVYFNYVDEFPPDIMIWDEDYWDESAWGN